MNYRYYAIKNIENLINRSLTNLSSSLKIKNLMSLVEERRIFKHKKISTCHLRNVTFNKQ